MKKRPKPQRVVHPAEGAGDDLAIAMRLHQAAVRDKSPAARKEARALYERVLVTTPRHPEALHYLGVLRHQEGDTEIGVAMIRRSIAERPRRADFHNNLGNVLKEAERLGEAASAYRAALALAPGNADAYSNLGTVWKATGEIEEAAKAYARALELDAKHVGAHHNLANVLQRLGRLDDAFAHYRRALELDPALRDARKSLALALHHAGRTDEAIAVLEAWLAREPGDAVATHLLAACTGVGAPARASDAYVESAFDAMAATFDEHLKGLGYRAPSLVEALLDRTLESAEGSLDVLDAGCGTGLCAAFLRPYARRLIGVDLSTGMLRRARALDTYDTLEHAELTEMLERTQAAYDLVVSADTLCYFGDLDRVMCATSRALRAGGRFVFTVEESTEARVETYELHAHGRYAHKERYVRVAASAAGFDVVACTTETLRAERSVPVTGFVVACLKRSE